jgi:hypothetical protein
MAICAIAKMIKICPELRAEGYGAFTLTYSGVYLDWK